MPSKAEKAEKDEVLRALTNKIFCDLMDDFVLDVALEAHHEVLKGRAVCDVCGTRCNAAHVPGPSNVSQNLTSSSRAATPSLTEGKSGTNRTPGSNTPTNAKLDGTLYLGCVNCQRQIASNYYAVHLSTCMGLASARRGPGRSNTKSKQSSDAGRSRSPASEAGSVSEESKSPAKGKGKSKSKRADEAEFNLKRKRISPTKKQKQKASGSPVSRVKSEPDVSGMTASIPLLPSSGSQSKIPSKLRDSSTAPFVEQSPTSSSRSSSPGASLSSTLSSSFKFKGTGNGAQTKSRPTPIPLKKASPPRPPPIVPAYMQDDEGDETGSSTDTDSS